MVIARDAASEAFYVHARLLDDFLRDEHDRGRSATAHDYTGTESTRLRPEWLLTVNKQVAHLDWDRGRYPGSEHLQDEILADLRQGLADFYRQLITERQAWFPALRDL